MRVIRIKSLLISVLLSLPLSFANAGPAEQDIVVTLLFTNDMESAYEPVPAWWREDIERIGGLAELTTLIKSIRREQPNVFLFDSGDIFTGALSRLTDGAMMFEHMITMGYDAMAIGNHEFDLVRTFTTRTRITRTRRSTRSLSATVFASASSASLEWMPLIRQRLREPSTISTSPNRQPPCSHLSTNCVTKSISSYC
jgi:2',3'-cyclic-nucleotide 2'-phosphodiesterase (5'-nucleotidase family)